MYLFIRLLLFVVLTLLFTIYQRKAVKCNVNKGVVSYYDLFIYSVRIILY